MPTSFNFFRLIQLIRKQWIENVRLYLFSLLALIGIIGLTLVFWITNSESEYREETLYVIFTFGIFITGAIFASMSFNMLGEKDKGTYWLSLPANHLEKLLCVIFYNLIVFTLVYCTCVFVLESLAITHVRHLVALYPAKYHFRPMEWNTKNGFSEVMPYFAYTFFAVQSYYLLGSVYFARFSFVITTVIGVALIGAFIWFGYHLFKIIYPEGYIWNGLPFSKNSLYKGGSYKLSGVLVAVLIFLLKFIWAPVFWIATWYRLKEKEI